MVLIQYEQEQEFDINTGNAIPSSNDPSLKQSTRLQINKPLKISRHKK